MCPTHRALRWLLALLIGMALLQPSFGAQLVAEPVHCSGMAADDGGGAAGHDDGAGCMASACDFGLCAGSCASACAALPAGAMRVPLASARGAVPRHGPVATLDRARAPETPPPIG